MKHGGFEKRVQATSDFKYCPINEQIPLPVRPLPGRTDLSDDILSRISSSDFTERSRLWRRRLRVPTAMTLKGSKSAADDVVACDFPQNDASLAHVVGDDGIHRISIQDHKYEVSSHACYPA